MRPTTPPCPPPQNSGGFTNLYYAESTDRINWRSAASPVLQSSRTQCCPWDNGEIYRSGFTVTNGAFDIWYSGRHIMIPGCGTCTPSYNDNEWHLGHVTGCLYDCESPSLFGSNATTYLTVPTYIQAIDPSQQLTNPDVAYVPGGWAGYKYWMAMTPYPNGDENYSNPSVVASNDGLNWTVPTGLTNPLVAKPTGGFNNDPVLVLVGSTMRMYFGQTFDQHHGATSNYHTDVRMMSSTNGTTWSAPQTVLTLPNYVMSSTVVYDGSMYYLWYVTSPAGCPSSSQTMHLQQSTDGITWTNDQTVSIPGLPEVPFEMDVHQDGSLYRMLIAAYPSTSTCGSTSIYYAESSDRINWTPRVDPVLRPTAVGWDNAQVYRPTFTGSGSFLRIWYPARHNVVGQPGVDPMSQDQWQVGYAEVCLTGTGCVPPAAVTDLGIGTGKANMAVSWTAPGQDGETGTASQYDLRFSTSVITNTNFTSATPISTGPPLPAGSAECVTVSPLSSCTTYYVAIKTQDDEGNWSDISNLPSARTRCSGNIVVECGGFRMQPASRDDAPTVMELAVVGSNPARGASRLACAIPVSAQGKPFELAVYDLIGRRLATLASGPAMPGHFEAEWDPSASGIAASRAGIYFVRFRLGDQVLTRTVALLP